MSEEQDKQRIAELEGMVKTLLTRLGALERQVNPAPRPPEPARLEGMPAGTLRLLDQVVSDAMPKEVLQRMQAAVPDSVVSEIAKDARRR
jgi:hypothetical protein